MEIMPFYDESEIGHESAVPCWPQDAEGNALDCQDRAVLVGVLGPDGLFRAEEEPAFDPLVTGYLCPAHRVDKSYRIR